jgi:hypothetical protein
MGKTVDMASLMAKNENTRAVGNMSVNARGDTIDAMGKIVKPVTEKVNKAYANTVGTRSAQSARQLRTPSTGPTIKADPIKLTEELTTAELELEQSFDDDVEIEKIKLEEIKRAKK